MKNTDVSTVLLAAVKASRGDKAKAENWFETASLAEFDGKTPAQLVRDGRAADVLRLISALEAGFLG